MSVDHEPRRVHLAYERELTGYIITFWEAYYIDTTHVAYERERY